MISAKRRYTSFIFLFVILAFLVFASYIFTGTTFVKGEDGFKQHIVALTYYGRLLRTLLSGAVPQWDFNIGEGADILQTLNYYVIGDPFTLLSVFFPSDLMYICYNLISILKMFAAGCAFIYLCNHFKVESDRGTIVAALSYALSAWAFIHGTRHLYFINPMIYMPLIVVGIDKLLNQKKPALFTFAVAVAAVSNFYFFYMIALLTAVYVLALLIYTYKTDFKAIVRKILPIFVFAAVGTVMASVTFVPVVNFFFADSRAGSFSFHLFYPPEVYFKMPLVFFVPEGIGYAMWLGFSAVTFMGLVSLFIEKEHAFLKILVVIAAIFFLFPIFGQIFNGFSYQSQRWCWAFVLLSCYVLSTQWEVLCRLKSRSWLIAACLVTGFFVFFHLVYPKELHRGISFVQAGSFFIVWLVFWKTKKQSKRNIVLVSVALLSIVITANYFFYIYGWLRTCVKPQRLKVLAENEATEIKSLGDTDFYRFSGDRLTYNINMLSGLSSPQYYWSLTNKDISEYRISVGRDNNLGFHLYCDYDGRTMLESLACVKYYCTKDPARVPFGFESTGLSNIYKSNNSLPLGYSYDSYILRDEFEKYPELQKQQILMQSLVLEKPLPDRQKSEFFFNEKKIDYEIIPSDDITVEKGKFIVNKEKASLEINFQSLVNSETYIYFKNLRFAGKNKFRFYQYSYYRAPIFIEQNGKKREVEFCLPREEYYVDIHNFVFNLGYDSEPKTKVTLTFDKKGIYSFDELDIYCQPFDAFPAQVENLKKDAWTDVHFGINRVSGTVDFSADKLLLISIPYAKGWSAFVDGQKTELLRGNIMNMALPMKKGEHTIELIYRTPFLRAGFCISVTTIILFSAFMLIKRRREGRKTA
ncbi:MAG: YfhO family protein [Spirochaetia bacterium]|nr:YfhO family protein [Spirochaetia bacterium]